MDEAERHEQAAAVWRLNAALCRFLAARADLNAAAARTAMSFRRLTDAIARSERREFESHPDIQYLNAQLDGFYR